MKLSELALQMRGMVSRGVVRTTKDEAETQTVDVSLYAGHDLTDVEVLYPTGFASRAEDNGLVVVLAIGGDGGDRVALPIASPGNRLGNLEPGEVALYSPVDGSRVHIKADGSMEIIATGSVKVNSAGPVDVSTPAPVTITSGGSITCTYAGGTVDMQAGFVRGRMSDGSRFAAGTGWAKIAAGGHHVAVSKGGITVSVPPVIGPDPAPDI